MSNKNLNPFFETLLPEVNSNGTTDKYGRFRKNQVDLEASDFPRILYYTNFGNFKRKCKIEYSFDNMVFDEFRQRTEEASKIFDKDLENSILYSTLTQNDDHFSLQTRLWCPYQLMPDVYVFLDFINDIELNQSRILEIGSRKSFIGSTKKIREDGISLTQIYQTNDVFNREYVFPSFSLISKGSIHVYSSEIETRHSEIPLKKSKIKILTDLNSSGIMVFNPDVIEDLKESARSKYARVGRNASSGERLRAYASLFSSSDETDPILSIDSFDFEGTIERLKELNLLNTEGLFEIEKNHKFLEQVIENLTIKS